MFVGNSLQVIKLLFNNNFSLFSVLYQKRYKRERKMRSRLQEQMENEYKKRNQIEEILKASGAPAEALRILAGNYYCYINRVFPWQMLIFTLCIARASDIKKTE